MVSGSYEFPIVWSVSSNRFSLLHDCLCDDNLRLFGKM